MKIKFFIKIGLFGVIIFFLLQFFVCQFDNNLLYAQNSKDAIAIRVIPNPAHDSALIWYEKQNFSGSPQAMVVDGYEGVRDGRTVYVNAANIDIGEIEGIGDDHFYTNIYLISYNQEAEQETKDIFGKILENWKFNANIESGGQCSVNNNHCVYDADCPLGEFCNSLKARIIRDTRRLADLSGIGQGLEKYRQANGNYPDLNAGSYMKNKTLSVWPSWHNVLDQYLDINLPVDPVNMIGETALPYHPQTGWDKSDKRFATDLNNFEFPPDSRLYFYDTDERGYEAFYCAQLETTYSDIETANCGDFDISNQAPQIVDFSLEGWPRQEFTGFLMAEDPDGDQIYWTISLESPIDESMWREDYYWEWDAGFSEFTTVENNENLSQKRIHAARAGLANSNGMYSIRATVRDEWGGEFSGVYPIRIGSYPIVINQLEGVMLIGNSRSFEFAGTDSSGNTISNIEFDNASLETNASYFITLANTAELLDYGMRIDGLNIEAEYGAGQQTGVYIINIHTVDVSSGDREDSSCTITVENHPPIIHSVNIDYANSDEEICLADCAFTIDNGEVAVVQVNAADSDSGHILRYELIDDFGVLEIDILDGEISGLSGLNFHNAEETSYSIEVQASDQYCANSLEAECSDTFSFDLTVDPWCSVAAGVNSLFFETNTELEMDNGEVATTDFLSSIGFDSGCSDIGNGIAHFTASGISTNKNIIFLLDVSGSMNGDNLPHEDTGWPHFNPLPLPPEEIPINIAKKALADIIQELNSIAVNTLPAEVTINIGVIAYAGDCEREALMVDAKNNIFIESLVDKVDAYDIENCGGYCHVDGTNILGALESANNLLDETNLAGDNIVILLSDGNPLVNDTYEYPYRQTDCWETGQCFHSDICGCGDCSPSVDPPVVGFYKKSDFKIAQICSYTCDDGSSFPCVWRTGTGNRTITQSDDVENYSTQMKNAGISLYTIFYDTGHQSSEIYDEILGYYRTINTDICPNNMCDWSSEIPGNCSECPDDPCGGEYAFSGEGEEIDELFDNALEGILSSPTDSVINGVLAGFPDDDNPNILLKEIDDRSLDDLSLLSCSEATVLSGVFGNSGVIRMDDIRFEYCDPFLHP